ncbi:MAG: hypothetical protein DLM71_03540 [Chloroflexi bacterium]|nr:MAG: hypothetical protein DLM71_03540 [Chloroflexota bacterium]
MADLSPDPDSTGETRDLGSGPDRESARGKRRWASVLGIIIAIVLVLLIVVAHLTGAIGPGLH